jgi:hypothetical protein
MELNRQKADLNKDNKLSSYEKKRGMAIETSMNKDKKAKAVKKPEIMKKVQGLRKPTDKKFMGVTSYKENM